MQASDSQSSVSTAKEVLGGEIIALYSNIKTQDANLASIQNVLKIGLPEAYYDSTYKLIDEIADLHRRMIDNVTGIFGTLTARDNSKLIVEKMNELLNSFEEIKIKEKSGLVEINELISGLKEDIDNYKKLEGMIDQYINIEILELRENQEVNYAKVDQVVASSALGVGNFQQLYMDFTNACRQLLENSLQLKKIQDPQEDSEEEQNKINSVIRIYPQVIHDIVNIGIAEDSAQAIVLANKVRTGETKSDDFQNAGELYQHFKTIMSYIEMANMGNTESEKEKLSDKNRSDMEGMREVIKYIQAESLKNSVNGFHIFAQEAIASNGITRQELDDLEKKHQNISAQMNEFKANFGDSDALHAMFMSLDTNLAKISILPLRNIENNDLSSSKNQEDLPQSNEEHSLQEDTKAFIEKLCNNPKLSDTAKNELIKRFVDELSGEQDQFGEALDLLQKMRAELNQQLDMTRANLAPLFQQQKAIHKIITAINSELVQLKQKNEPFDVDKEAPQQITRLTR